MAMVVQRSVIVRRRTDRVMIDLLNLRIPYDSSLFEHQISRGEDLALDARGRDALLHEVEFLVDHELLWAADEVLSAAMLEIELLGLELGQVHAFVVVICLARAISAVDDGLEDLGVEVAVLLAQIPDVLLEGDVLAAAMYPSNLTAGLVLHNSVGDGNHGGDADTGRDQDQGHGAGVVDIQEELAGRVGDLEDRADGGLIDKVVGDGAGIEEGLGNGVGVHGTLVAADGDTVVVLSPSLTEGVLSGLKVAVGDLDLDGDVLAREISR